jgi:hypothetical protein
MKLEVGDTVRVIGKKYIGHHLKVGELAKLLRPWTKECWIVVQGDLDNIVHVNDFEFVGRWKEPEVAVVPDEWIDKNITDKKPDGGPAEYYDMPANVITLNDVIEWKGETSWKGDSFHLGNILKAAWRWGIKEGTTKEYDARKFMYSGARLLMKYAGVASVRKTLQQMLDDPQFKEKS